MKLVFAATGASGAVYLQRLLARVDSAANEVHLVFSTYAKQVVHEELGQHAAEVVVVVVEQHHVPGFRPAAGHQVVRRQHVAALRVVEGGEGVAARQVAQPFGAGGDENVISTQFGHRLTRLEVERRKQRLPAVQQALDSRQW